MYSPCPGPIISFPSCPSLAFSFFPNRRPMEDLMPFFFGCLWRESWLLATLLWPSVSNAVVRLETDKQINSGKVRLCLYAGCVWLLSFCRLTVRHCVKKQAACGSCGLGEVWEVARSRIWWWPCPLDRPRPPLRSVTEGIWIKGTVHPKMKILSFNNPHVDPKM